MTLQFFRISRHTVIMNIKKYSIRLLALTLLTSAAFGNAITKHALLMAMKANGKQMTSFQWKQKVTVMRKGKALDPMIEELRFDANGQLQRTTLVKPEEKHMGPLRARKAAEVKESVQDVMQLARRYASPQLLGHVIEKSELWDGQGRLRVDARGVIHPADEMTISISGATYLATRVDCKTRYEDDPVGIAINYQQLPNGPSMMMWMTVQIPGEDIVVNVEAYDFVRLAAHNRL